MLIDVIIPVFNRAHCLEKAIESVLGQYYRHFQLTVVDDGSVDDIKSVIERYQGRNNITFLRQENHGVSAARNFGLKSTAHPWVAFLDSDDEWLPHKLEKQVEFLKKNPDCTFLHSDEIWMRNGVRVNPKKKFHKGHEDLFRRSLEMCIISPSTVLMKRSIGEKFNFFNERFPVCEDYDLWLKVLLEEKIGYLAEHLIIKNGGHPDQLSTKFPAMDYWRIVSMLELLEGSILSESHRELIICEIKKKSPILLKGYLKYQNEKMHNELLELLTKSKIIISDVN